MFVPDVPSGRQWPRGLAAGPPQADPCQLPAAIVALVGRSPVQVEVTSPTATTSPTSPLQGGGSAETGLGQKDGGLQTHPLPHLGSPRFPAAEQKPDRRWEREGKGSAVPMGLSRQTHGPPPTSVPLQSPQAGGQQSCYPPSSATVPLAHTSAGQRSGNAARCRDTNVPCCPVSPHEA